MAATDYAGILKKTKEKGLALLNDTQGWTTVGSANEPWLIERKQSPDTKLYVYRTTQSLNAPVEVVRDTLSPLPCHREMDWDEAIKEKTVLQQISDNITLYVTRTHSIAKGIISGREFVDVSCQEEIENGYFIYGCGVVYPSIPSKESHVRGFNHCTALKFEKDPEKAGYTKVTGVSEMDLKGMIPQYVVDSTVPGVLSTTYTEWFKFLKKEGHPVV